MKRAETTRQENIASRGGPVSFVVIGGGPTGVKMAGAIAEPAHRAQGHATPAAFAYRNHGKLATIGRKCAVANFGWEQVCGFPAWVLWSTAHIYFLVGFRNRLIVGANWLRNYVTFDRGARLITARTNAGQM